MNKLKIGVLGGSEDFVKHIILPISKSKTVKLSGIASCTSEKASLLAEKWNIGKAYGSYEALLEDPEIEAVYLPLPNHMHLEWIKKAADAGKHILYVNPFTLNPEETEEAIRYVEGKGVKVLGTFMYHLHPKWERVSELVRNNEIGRIMTVHSMFTYANLNPVNIRNIKSYDCGALMDIGCFVVFSTCEIMGRTPERVMGVIEKHPVFQTDLLTSGILDFGNARGLFSVSAGNFDHQEVSVIGTEGVIVIMVPYNDFNDVKGEIEVRNAMGSRTIEFEPINQYQLIFESFAAAVREECAPEILLSESLNKMKVINALKRSADSSGWVIVSSEGSYRKK